MFNKLVKLIGGSNEKELRKLSPIVDSINALEPKLQLLSDEELQSLTAEFKTRLQKNNTSVDDLLVEAFAAVREAATRVLDQRHFDVQLIGGIALHQGKIAEMKTGEGKTLAATLAAYLNALSGSGVHVVTVNDYLAQRDAQWMGSIYHLLGMTTGALQHDAAYIYNPCDPKINDTTKQGQSTGKLIPVERREAYNADITYGTNNEFGFDYLRDNMVANTTQRVQKNLAYTIVDEVDSILIDEARTPLIISGPAEESGKEYQRFARISSRLKENLHFNVDAKYKSVSLTQEGITLAEQQLKISNLYDPSNTKSVHYLENAMKANSTYQRDREYVVKDGEVVIVDTFTGRLTPGRRYSDGLHQALEAKENLNIKRENITYASITIQNYFRLYTKLAGMTGTAATEAEEFWKIYELEVMEIPTNLVMIRKDETDLIYLNEEAKFNAVALEIEKRNKQEQPILVGTTDISKSERLSNILKHRGIKHEILNAKHHEREANIIAEAGRPCAVTVATNMAGRGTDIVLGGNPEALNIDDDQWENDHKKVVDLGGLFIIGTERHEARRIDNQLRGRGGRQGDPGTSRFYVALNDDLMKRFGGERLKSIMDWAGLDEDSPIENRMVSKSIENAQVKVESHHFDIRKQLVEYDDVINTHRGIIYEQRDQVIKGVNLKTNINIMVEQELKDIVDQYFEGVAPENRDIEGFLGTLTAIFPISNELLDRKKLTSMKELDVKNKALEQAQDAYETQENSLTSEGMRTVERHLMLNIVDSNWIQHLTAMENLRQGIGLYAYGQRDPLVMYKKEGFESFNNLTSRIRHDIVHSIYRFEISSTNRRARQTLNGNDVETSVTNRATNSVNKTPTTSPVQKLGRNEPCHCGSGKKYKRCHGT